MKVGKKLRLLRAEKGWTKSSAAKSAGIPVSSYRNYEKESLNRKLAGNAALALAKAFGVTVEYLLDDTKGYPPGPVDRTLQEVIDLKTEVAAAHPRKAQVATKPPTVPISLDKINVVGHVAAGETDISYDDAGLPVGGSIDEPLDRLPDVTDQYAYGLTISGNSMLPGYPQGTKVIVSPSEKVKSGDLVICRLRSTGKVYIKEIAFSSGMVLLKSHNTTAYEPVAVPKEDILFCHKVVWAKRP